MRTHADIARACFQAYADGDRAALDAVLAADLHFTSPLDNGVDLNTCLEIGWPKQANIVRFRFVRVVEHGATVLLTDAQTRSDGSVGRSTEVLTIRDGRIHAVEVYFGWLVPIRRRRACISRRDDQTARCRPMLRFPKEKGRANGAPSSALKRSQLQPTRNLSVSSRPLFSRM
ncbi:hypothetical protein [Luteimonas sp. 3794]|uniref:hypothetical protein n=1 Tax=Luteimonas sp. 3794 TaxID=2817730 RepID=UPI002856307B|nr:hypothetical protein [Luteimonas sp. 3794]MDR6992748.1 ketosteroid isomerase-like protein [Luteimonas sp. 3794]